MLDVDEQSSYRNVGNQQQQQQLAITEYSMGWPNLQMAIKCYLFPKKTKK